jgi:uncharacterized protein (TIGR02328 family)
MRLWHYKLLPHLPLQHLLGQHRECCALRGLGWGKPHSTVDYVFCYPPFRLYQYHCKVLTELEKLWVNYDTKWLDRLYRGKGSVEWPESRPDLDCFNYPEHNPVYYQECLDNLERKGFITQSSKWFRFVPRKAIRKEE